MVTLHLLGRWKYPQPFFSCCTMCKSVNSRGTAIKPDLMMQLINAAAENDATLASQESCWTRKKQTLDVAQTGREASHSRGQSEDSLPLVSAGPHRQEIPERSLSWSLGNSHRREVREVHSKRNLGLSQHHGRDERRTTFMCMHPPCPSRSQYTTVFWAFYKA